MDKPKILIVGAGPSSASLARLLGTAAHETAIAKMKDHLQSLSQIDYGDLEARVLSQFTRGEAKTMSKLALLGLKPDLVIYDDTHMPKAADHPSRKREPKGPRSKWGKLK